MPLTYSQLWDLGFTAFEVFIGIGILWMLFIEPRLPSQDFSFPLMTLLAILGAALYFIRGWRQAGRAKIEAQKQIEAAAARFEDEVG